MSVPLYIGTSDSILSAIGPRPAAMAECMTMQSLDEFQFHAVLASRPGVSLVLFTSPTCGTCRRVEALLPAAAPAMAHLFKVDVQRATGLARAYEVFHLPALFLFRDGRYHARLDCEITPAALAAAIRAALAGPPEEEP